jgi:predicted kinase
VPFGAVWCDAPDAVLAGRLQRRAADPREVSDAGPALLGPHRAQYEPPADEPGTIRVDTSASLDAAVSAALRGLGAG